MRCASRSTSHNDHDKKSDGRSNCTTNCYNTMWTTISHACTTSRASTASESATTHDSKSDRIPGIAHDLGNRRPETEHDSMRCSRERSKLPTSQLASRTHAAAIVSDRLAPKVNTAPSCVAAEKGRNYQPANLHHLAHTHTHTRSSNCFRPPGTQSEHGS